MNDKSRSRYRLWLLSLILIGVAVWYFPLPDNGRTARETSKKSATGSSRHNGEQTDAIRRNVLLYIPNANLDYLAVTKEMVDGSQPLELQIRLTLKKLFSPDTERSGFYPESMQVREVFVHDRLAVISLGAKSLTGLNSGLWTELLAVYGIVNTVTLSFDEVDNVKILIDDKETDFFISHVTISTPMAPDMSLIKAGDSQVAGNG